MPEEKDKNDTRLPADYHVAEDDEIDLSEVLYRILDHWKLIIIVGILGAALAWTITHFFITPQYKSTAKIYVLSSSDSVVNLSDMQIGTYLASDYQEVFNTREVHEQVISNLSLPYTYSQLQKKLDINNITGTRILGITVEDEDPNQAATIANEFATVASDYIALVMQTDRPTSLSMAVPPQEPSSPKTMMITALGGVGGVLIVILIIVLIVMTDNRV